MRRKKEHGGISIVFFFVWFGSWKLNLICWRKFVGLYGNKMEQIEETLYNYVNTLEGLDGNIDDISMLSYVRFRMYKFMEDDDVLDTIFKADKSMYCLIMRGVLAELKGLERLYELAQPREYDGQTMRILERLRDLPLNLN